MDTETKAETRECLAAKGEAKMAYLAHAFGKHHAIVQSEMAPRYAEGFSYFPAVPA